MKAVQLQPEEQKLIESLARNMLAFTSKEQAIQLILSTEEFDSSQKTTEYKTITISGLCLNIITYILSKKIGGEAWLSFLISSLNKDTDSARKG